MPYGEYNQTAQDLWDFTRCQRADGTYYGTSGKCRSGNEVGAKLAKLPVEKLKKLAANPKLTSTQKKQVNSAIADKKGTPTAKKPSESKPVVKKSSEKNPEADKAKKVEAVKKAQEAYTKALKKSQEALAKGDYKDIEKQSALVKKLADKLAVARAAAMTPEERKALGAEAKKRLEWDQQHKLRDQKQETTKLSPKEQKALKDYTGEGDEGGRSYRNVNACLRSPQCRDKAAQQFAKELDQTVSKLPSNDEGNPFYRGVNATSGGALGLYKALEKAQPGTTLKDPGFGSFSSRRAVAAEFMNSDLDAKSILFVSRNKGLTPINMFSELPNEYEAILPRGSEQTIRSVTKAGNTLVVELD